MAAAWRTYTPDGRELAVEHEGGRWTASCDGKHVEATTALEAISAAVGHDDASIGTSGPIIAAWVASHAAQLESEAGQTSNLVGGMTIADAEVLAAGLDEIQGSPPDAGRVELIVRRPAEGEREVVDEGVLDTDEGLVGDSWRARGSSRSGDGSSNPATQVTMMNARVIALIAGTRERWPLAGDQLYVDFDLSIANLPPGTLIGVGSAVLEVSEEPHTGCAKFSARFGSDAIRFVNSPDGRELRLRGMNARVVQAGAVRPGDGVRKL